MCFRIVRLICPLYCLISLKCVLLFSHSMSQSRSRSGIKAGDNNVIHTYSKLLRGNLVKRYQRFLADIDFVDGVKTDTSSSMVKEKRTENETEAKVTVTSTTNLPAGLEGSTAAVVHCPNTGSMFPLVPPDNMYPDCACSTAPLGTNRKYPNTLEMIREGVTWVGVHSSLANKMAGNALNANLIDGCTNFSSLQNEFTILEEDVEETVLKGKNKGKIKKKEKTRIDFKLTWSDGSIAFVWSVSRCSKPSWSETFEMSYETCPRRWSSWDTVSDSTR
mmetsp:Transcript_17866/g.17191  ORF Transcript_17866/g.17191 Transcript_17866/m.17191 type:complete len:276 (+) Transcript_17866:258-1085(+)